MAWHGQVEHENENENDTWAGEETKTADGPRQPWHLAGK